MMIDAINVFGDNEGTIKVAVNKHASFKTKHIDVKHHLARDACDKGKVRMVYVRIEDQHTTYKSSISIRRQSSM